MALAAKRCLVDSARGDVIICPSSLKHNWLNEVRVWLGADYPVQIIDNGSKAHVESSIKKLLFAPGTKIVSYDMAAKLFSLLTPRARRRGYFNTVICDESHYIKETSTRRYLMLNAAIKNSRNVFLLSGTPAPNRNSELFAQFSLINPKVYSNKRLFTDRYSDGHLDTFGRYDDRGASCTQELAYAMTHMAIRLRREEHLDELPHVTRTKVILSPTSTPSAFKEQMKEFRAVEQDANAAAKMQCMVSELFRETARVKEAPVLEFLNSFCTENSEKTVLFCTHHSMLDAVTVFLQKHGENNHVVISGKTPMGARPTHRAVFDKCAVPVRAPNARFLQHRAQPRARAAHGFPRALLDALNTDASRVQD